MRSRIATALLGLAGSAALSVVFWRVFGTPFVFLFVPFVPFLLGRRETRERPPERVCPECGFRTRDTEFEYCPRDGHRLEER